MNDELERLREVVRSLVAHRIAWFKFTTAVNKQKETGERFTESEMEEMGSALYYSGEALDRAMVQLAEVNPQLVNGFPFEFNHQS